MFLQHASFLCDPSSEERKQQCQQCGAVVRECTSSACVEKVMTRCTLIHQVIPATKCTCRQRKMFVNARATAVSVTFFSFSLLELTPFGPDSAKKNREDVANLNVHFGQQTDEIKLFRCPFKS